MNAELQCIPADAAVPQYLQETYWWAYVHPRAVQVFERQWLVNLILWGNFNRLRDAAIGALGPDLEGRTLQVACVYGDLTRRIAARLAHGGQLHVVDVLRIQLDNLARKLPGRLLRPHGRHESRQPPVELIQGDSAALEFASSSYDRAVVLPAARATRERPARDTRGGIARREAGWPGGDRRLPSAAPAQPALLANGRDIPDARAVRTRPVAKRGRELVANRHRARLGAQADLFRRPVPADLHHGVS